MPRTSLLKLHLPRALRFVTRARAFVLLALCSCGFAQAAFGTVADAAARAYEPASGQIFQGAVGQPVSEYVSAVGKHPAVYEEFVAWGQWLPGITQDALDAHARMMIHITTAYGTREAITPGAIARGAGDAWLLGLANAIYQSGNVTYVRLMAEMDGYWNPYCAYNSDGTPRDADHSAAAFRRAWKRVTLIMRGGPLTRIDSVLARLGMPPLRTDKDLPQPKVAMVWVPQVAGSPDVPGNAPSAYWPGRAWVDWVGTDFYSRFPNFSGLGSFYNAFPGKPFTFGEYALWGSDDPGFVEEFFAWVRSHPRARMLIYNQGLKENGPFRLSHYPAAAHELRRMLAGPRFPAYAPEWAH